MDSPGSSDGKAYPVCDTHFHIFGPFSEFPLEDGASYLPAEATVADYKVVADHLGIGSVVVVQGGCYGTNNDVTLNAVREFGADRARAIAIIDDSFDDRKLMQLHDGGVRGVRLNLISDGNIDSSVVLARAQSGAIGLAHSIACHERPDCGDRRSCQNVAGGCCH